MIMKKQIFMLTFLTFVSLQASENIPLTTLNSASARWNAIQQEVVRKLNYDEDFAIELDESVSNPVVDLENRKIFVSSKLNDDVDQNGLTALIRYDIAKAFGREIKKDEPFTWVTTKPRLVRPTQKKIGWALLGACAITAVVGAGYLIDGAFTYDDEHRKNSFKAGIGLLGFGVAGTFAIGGRLLDLYGVAVNLTKKGKFKNDATYFAIEHLSKEDLQAVAEDLNKKTCWPSCSDLAIKNYIELQVQNLEEASTHAV